MSIKVSNSTENCYAWLVAGLGSVRYSYIQEEKKFEPRASPIVVSWKSLKSIKRFIIF